MEAVTTQEVLRCIRTGETFPMGRHNDYKSLAFTVYKIAYDFSRTKREGPSASLSSQITENLFSSSSLGFKNKLKVQTLRALNKKDDKRISRLFLDLIKETQKINPLEIDERLGLIYDMTSEIADEFFKYILKSLEDDIARGDVINLIRNISSSIPGLFLSLPFFSALKHTYQSRKLSEQLRGSLKLPEKEYHQKVLCFSDSIEERYNISELDREPGLFSSQNGSRMRLVTSIPPGIHHKRLPLNVLFLPTFYSAPLPGKSEIPLCFPSVLKALQIIHDEDPTEIYVSSPGPVGLFGLLCARLLNIPAIGIYQPQIIQGVENISDDQGLLELVESYTRWFYSMMDVIKVTTPGHMDFLESRGIEKCKIQVASSA
jgi:hypothetical protein